MLLKRQNWLKNIESFLRNKFQNLEVIISLLKKNTLNLYTVETPNLFSYSCGYTAVAANKNI